MKEKKKRNDSSNNLKVRFSLKFKFSIAIIILTVTIITSMTYYFLQKETRLLTDNIIDNARVMMNTFEAVAKTSLGDNDLVIFDTINIFKQNRSFRYAYVTDPNGTVIINHDPDEAPKTSTDKYMTEVINDSSLTSITESIIQDAEEEGGVLYDFILPVTSRLSDTRIAIIRLGFSDEQVRSQIEELRNTILIIALIFIFASIIASFLLSFITTKPLKRLSEGVAIIATGDMNHKINVSSKDEIGRLAKQFNAMTSELKVAKNKEIESRLMAEQLELAKEIQEGLNPMGFYDKKGIQIKGYTRAAKGVGGDYFDYIDIDDSRIGVLISDVSGKGVPASLVMVMIRTVFVSSVQQNSSTIQCKNVVTAVNNSLSADFAIDKFATLMFIIYDRKTETLSFTNAGHGPLFCYRAAQKHCTVTSLDGMPIGIMDDASYLQSSTQFKTGDITVLYTDGITEMRNEAREEYGRTRMQHLVMENCKKSAEELTSIIVSDVDDFRGEVPAHDDMTIVVVKRTE
ncbi:MAG: SpoIIE family protein phosphatase [Spirochaetes bacterium]|jgi:serine phosphatase RsbU (regulator of sigma subunit)|nr:SpoIIE family protein phosphatase [Spirochaetota bacterium]